MSTLFTSMITLPILIKRLDESAILPSYAHRAEEDAGLDIHSLEDIVIPPGVPTPVRTGLAVEMPPGVEMQIRSRSGLALKHAVIVLNAPATIDPGFRGELKVILFNLGTGAYKVSKGDRIAQMVIAPYFGVDWREREELATSSRGAGGFGSSGY